MPDNLNGIGADLMKIKNIKTPPTKKALSAPLTLTPKQERFCQVYLETGNATAAYRAVYTVDTMTSKTTNEAACRLLKQTKIAARIKDTHDRMVDEIVWSRQQSVRTLRDIAIGLDRTTTCQARIAAVKELNAMFGYNAPVKSQVLGADGQPANLKITVKFVAPAAAGPVG